VRFPKDDRAKRALVQEARVLDLARRHVTVRLPHFEHRSADFVAYQWLPGEPLPRQALLGQDEATQAGLVEPLAAFLRQLHAIPPREVGQQAIGRSDAQRSRDDWLHFYDALERELFPILMPDARDWVRGHFAPVIDGRLSLEYEPALIHGDLAGYHLLHEPAQRRLTGVLDFGTAGLGDPAVDFACIIGEFGEQVLRRMSAYDPAIVAALDRARFLAGTLELQWALTGLRSRDASWFVCHIGRARDVLPIGQRWM
jgi:aminoglycoside 2''-phosphotransferase